MPSETVGDLRQYGADFFRNQRDGSLSSARVVAPIVLHLLDLRSVVDVGCGMGTWLHAFAECGLTDILGCDGNDVDRSLLAIPPPLFRRIDLRVDVSLDRRFDLALSLEVAEHLPESCAPGFVRSLTAAAPSVLFSAAIPGQGGTGHLNEQWQDYWRDLFATHGFQPVDCIRPAVRGRPDVRFWYQQNIILYCDASVLQAHPDLQPVPAEVSLNLVHPTLYGHARSAQELSLRRCVRMLPGLMSKAVARRMQPPR